MYLVGLLSKLHEKMYKNPLPQYLAELFFLIFLRLEQLDGCVMDCYNDYPSTGCRGHILE